MADYPDRNAAGTLRRFGKPDPNTPPVTFANVIENERFLFPHCGSCQHRGTPIDPREMAKRFGIDRAILPLRQLLKCERCGTRGRATFHLDFPPGCPPGHTRSIGAYEWWDAQPARDVLDRMKKRGK
jgi:hypothetical protein